MKMRLEEIGKSYFLYLVIIVMNNMKLRKHNQVLQMKKMMFKRRIKMKGKRM
jgi:hypothetical protein